MMGAFNLESDLWFLAYYGDELVGAALCFDYPQRGWVRQCSNMLNIDSKFIECFGASEVQ